MIIHQGVGKNIDVILIRHFSDHIQKSHPIPVITKNIFSFISTGQHMIQPAPIFYSPCSAHKNKFIAKAGQGQLFYSLYKM